MLSALIEKLAAAFHQAGIPYMVIGGQATLVYGEFRTTNDIDITLGVGTEQLGAILDCISNLSLKPIPQDPEEFVRQRMVLPMHDPETGLRVDLIFSYSPYEHEAIKRAHTIKIGQTNVSYVSPEDLIVHKIIAGRPRDLEDVKGVMLKQPGLDREMVRHWLRQFDQALAADYLATFTKLEENLK